MGLWWDRGQREISRMDSTLHSPCNELPKNILSKILKSWYQIYLSLMGPLAEDNSSSVQRQSIADFKDFHRLDKVSGTPPENKALLRKHFKVFDNNFSAGALPWLYPRISPRFKWFRPMHRCAQIWRHCNPEKLRCITRDSRPCWRWKWILYAQQEKKTSRVPEYSSPRNATYTLCYVCTLGSARITTGAKSRQQQD